MMREVKKEERKKHPLLFCSCSDATFAPLPGVGPGGSSLAFRRRDGCWTPGLDLTPGAPCLASPPLPVYTQHGHQLPGLLPPQWALAASQRPLQTTQKEALTLQSGDLAPSAQPHT